MIAQSTIRKPFDRAGLRFWMWAGFALLILMVWLGAAEFYTRGEPREATVVQAMVDTGNYISPRVYGDRVPSKPPLFHWLGAIASIFTDGVNEFSVRLPSLLAAFITIVALYLAVKREYDSSRAIAVVVLLATSIEWFRGAVVARVDMLLTCWLTLAFLAGYQWQRRNYQGLGWPVIIFSALAALTKGPVGVALPCGVLLISQLLQGQPALQIARRMGSVVLLALIPYLIWVLAGVFLNGDALLSKVLYENVERFAGTTGDKPHAHSIFYIWGTLLIGFLPWTLAGVAQVIHSARWRWNPLQWWRTATEFERHAALVVIVVVGFFSIPESKRGVYLLPAYPFLAILIAHAVLSILDRLPDLGHLLARLVGSVSLAFGLILGVTILIRLFPVDPTLQVHARYLHEVIGVGECLLLLVGMVVLAARKTYLQRVNARHAAIGSLGYLFLLGYAVGLPATASLLSERNFASTVAARVPPGSVLFSLDNELYGLNFYSGRRMSSKDLHEVSVGDTVVLFTQKIDELNSALQTRGFAYREMERSVGYVQKWGRHLSLGKIEEQNSSPQITYSDVVE